jgi:sarcosine oxidase
MPNQFDFIVVGLGAMGSAACCHLACAGKRVLGLDRFAPPHTLGSSHGRTRIIREAYFEHPTYVPLVQRAYELWADLERQTERQLFLQTGGLMIGPPEGCVVAGAKRSAELHRLPHEVLSSAEVRRRFPALRPDDGMSAVWEPRAGILFPEACVAAHLSLARQHGAAIQLEESVLEWKPERESVRIKTTKDEYEAGRVLFSMGAWTSSLLPDLPVPLNVERQVLYWFEPKAEPARFLPERCPIYLWEHPKDRFFYGFPDLGDGIKVARHHEGEITQPDTVSREVNAEETEGMRQLVRHFLPDADGPLRSATVCLYTDTPDHHFLIDTHPAFPQVLIASPCSGHGFKFSSAIGEVLADLLISGRSRFDLSLFRFGARLPV